MTDNDDGIFSSTPYRNVGKLGQGGMGNVYLVEHRQTGAKCVAKVIHRYLAPDAQAVDRFRLEAQSLGKLEHPNIVEVLAAGNLPDGRPYIVLEYLKGSTLGERLQDGPLSAQEALSIAHQFLSALEAAHEFGIVHRDFKPANVFLARQSDGTEVAKVLDFGLAKVLPNAPTEAPAPLADPTGTGMVVGTPRYMSPEAARGAPLDQRADVYAAALVLYRMLAGRGPFDHHVEGRAQLKAHVSETPPPLDTWIEVNGSLQKIILQALAKDPRKRFDSALAFSNALDSAWKRAQVAPKSENSGPPIRASRAASPSKSPRGRLPGWLQQTHVWPFALFLLALILAAATTALLQISGNQ